MCGCSTHQSQSGRAIEHAPDALVLRVEDMACKMVFVRGTRDLEAVKAIVCEAGYTSVETELV